MAAHTLDLGDLESRLIDLQSSVSLIRDTAYSFGQKREAFVFSCEGWYGMANLLDRCTKEIQAIMDAVNAATAAGRDSAGGTASPSLSL